MVFWCALIFFFSSIPDLNSGLEYDYPLRKVAHAVEYAVLLLLARRPLSPARALLFCVFYACTDEFHQTFVQGRNGCVSDVCIDSAGALAAWAWRRWKR